MWKGGGEVKGRIAGGVNAGSFLLNFSFLIFIFRAEDGMLGVEFDRRKKCLPLLSSVVQILRDTGIPSLESSKYSERSLLGRSISEEGSLYTEKKVRCTLRRRFAVH